MWEVKQRLKLHNLRIDHEDGINTLGEVVDDTIPPVHFNNDTGRNLPKATDGEVGYVPPDPPENGAGSTPPAPTG